MILFFSFFRNNLKISFLQSGQSSNGHLEMRIRFRDDSIVFHSEAELQIFLWTGYGLVARVPWISRSKEKSSHHEISTQNLLKWGIWRIWIQEIRVLSSKENSNKDLRVVHTQVISFLKSMSETVGSDVERLWIWNNIFLK